MSRRQAAMAVAYQVRECAHHYNGFNVSCVGWAGKQLLIGVNVKPTKESAPVCAEEQVMLQAETLGVMLDGMVIVGEPRQEDVENGLRTLHCCGERCRPAMRRRNKSGKVVRPDTVLICVNPQTLDKEEFTVEALHAFHGESLDD